MGFILSLAIAIVVSALFKKLNIFQNVDSELQSKVTTGVWIAFALYAFGSFFYGISDLFAGNGDLPRYLGWFVYDFAYMTYMIVLVNVFTISATIVNDKINNKLEAKVLDEDEIISLNVKSLLSEKINNVCHKVYKYGRIAIIVLFAYNGVSSFINRIRRLSDIDDLYYAVSYISGSITTAFLFVAILVALISVCCLALKNQLVVTNKRVYGIGNLFKLFDVGYEAITGVEAKGDNGVVIKLGLKDIGFLSLEKRDEVMSLINPNVKPLEKIEITTQNPDSVVEDSGEVVQPEAIAETEENIDAATAVDVEKEKGDEIEMITINPLLKGGYRKLSTVLVLSFLTLGIYFLYWVYKTTKLLNLVDENEQRSPGKKLLLCMFIPFYIIWWFYKSADAVKKLERAMGIKSDIGILCPFFSMLCPFFSIAVLQDSINRVISKLPQ